MDAVFKLLHEEVARKATDRERKKNERKNLVFVLQCVKLKKTKIK